MNAKGGAQAQRKAGALRVALIDYGSGNLRSAAKACARAMAERELQGEVRVTVDAGFVRDASHLILPGVGAFADCRRGLDRHDALLSALRRAVLEEGKPFLGICVGMQLLASRGFEHGVHDGLDWMGGEVRPLQAQAPLTVPHMGWNRVRFKRPHPLRRGLDDDAHFFYFAHSYVLRCRRDDDVLADCAYGERFAACVVHGNVAGVQFHPEKSQHCGLHFLGNFLSWHPDGTG